MFDLREFLKKGLLDAVGKKPTYWIVLNSAGWFEKGVLVETDLAEIDEAMTAKEEENAMMEDVQTGDINHEADGIDQKETEG